MKFICKSCQGDDDVEPNHADCRGKTWCDCQHRTDRKPAK